jgi:hypothetical protein
MSMSSLGVGPVVRSTTPSFMTPSPRFDLARRGF